MLGRNGADGEVRRLLPVLDPLLLQLLRSQHVDGVPKQFAVAEGEEAPGIGAGIVIPALLVFLHAAAAGGELLLAGGVALAVRLYLEALADRLRRFPKDRN